MVFSLYPALPDNPPISELQDFTQCPNAEIAKKYGLLQVLPMLCNCDFYGISQIHGKLIREGTCGNSTKCDYYMVDHSVRSIFIRSSQKSYLSTSKRVGLQE